MKKVMFVLLALGVLCAAIALTARQSRAEGPNFQNVQTFMTGGGQLGFFNKDDGKVYLYTLDKGKCLLVAQVKELGEPMEILEKNHLNDVATMK
ncbi:MAG: hypothetical protein HQL18_01035 [Candidatus Omnitrophica bacterium]|nr:hypothetical protein [Candidatus Omnitrophota bacterium]